MQTGTGVGREKRKIKKFRRGGGVWSGSSRRWMKFLTPRPSTKRFVHPSSSLLFFFLFVFLGFFSVPFLSFSLLFPFSRSEPYEGLTDGLPA